MIAPMLIAEVRRLLGERKLSRRKIADRLGLCRNTVNAIALGRRSDYEAMPQAQEEEEPTGPPARCSSCGGMVYAPCRLCGVRRIVSSRAHAKRLEPASRTSSDSESPRLNLRPEHHVRYEEVRAWRKAAPLRPFDGASR